jgi:quercetin dioxygenase-like cupin family protein
LISPFGKPQNVSDAATTAGLNHYRSQKRPVHRRDLIPFFLEVMMSQKEKNFFNIDAMEQGIARTLVDGITTRIFPGNQAMLSVVRIAPNAVGAIHTHPQEQWGIMIDGSAIRIQDGEEIHVQKGDFWCSPGGIEHGVIGGPNGAVILDVFSPPRPEYTHPGNGFATE